ncbi:MAG: ABC transporter permease subunit [Candidatus Lokiarchaeota archaeon]|nr:ABC transporter permease subunit [Candidatus Lokiarchaeota archaeon]
MKRFFSSIKELILEKKFMILILGGGIGLLSFFIVALISDLDLQSMQDIFSAFPEGFLEFFGDLAVLANPYGFWTMEMLSFIWLYAGILFVFTASSLLSHEVENKTIDLSLSKPISRDNFLGSKITFLYIYIMTTIGIFFLISLGSMAASSTFRAEGIFLERFLATYFSVVLFLGALAMVAKFMSTIFLSTKKSVALGVMILFIMFFLGEFYVYMDEAIQDIKYISIFYYFNPVDYLVKADTAIFIRDIYILGVINVALIVGSLIIFDMKDIPN